MTYFKFKKGSTDEMKKKNIELRVLLLTDDRFHHKVCDQTDLLTLLIILAGRTWRMALALQKALSLQIFLRWHALKTIPVMVQSFRVTLIPSPLSSLH